MAYSSLPAAERTLALVVRHGRTAANEGRPVLRAWEDLPIDRNGELDADLAGNQLKRYNPQIVYSSDLTRDTQTAVRISVVLGNIATETAFELRTADMGTLTGEYSDEVIDQVRNWYERPWIPAPSGESYDQFVGRLFPWIDRKLDLFRYVPQMRPGVFVSHGRVFAALDSRYNFKPPIEGKMAVHGGAAEIREKRDGRITFEFLGPTEDLLKDA
jgi:broad specificity phosphatase PhoE